MEGGFKHDALTESVIAAAIEVHDALGPGLLESAYEECLCHELALRGIPFKRQLELPVVYKGVKLDCGFRIDIEVNQELPLELKTVEQILPVHQAQLLTYLRLRDYRRGLIINFYVNLLKNGICRLVNSY